MKVQLFVASPFGAVSSSFSLMVTGARGENEHGGLRRVVFVYDVELGGRMIVLVGESCELEPGVFGKTSDLDAHVPSAVSSACADNACFHRAPR